MIELATKISQSNTLLANLWTFGSRRPRSAAEVWVGQLALLVIILRTKISLVTSFKLSGC